jgi:hypothetical protein
VGIKWSQQVQPQRPYLSAERIVAYRNATDQINTIFTSFATRFKVKQFYVLATQFPFAFCMDLGTNSDYFHVTTLTDWLL